MNPTLILDILEKVLEKYFSPNYFQSGDFRTDNKFKEFTTSFGRYSLTEKASVDLRKTRDFIVICEPFDTMESTLKISVSSLKCIREGIYLNSHVSFTDFTKVSSLIRDPYLQGAKNLDSILEEQGFEVFPINKLLLPIEYHNRVMEMVENV